MIQKTLYMTSLHDGQWVSGRDAAGLPPVTPGVDLTSGVAR